MTRKEGSKNIKNNWIVKKTNEDGEVQEIELKTQKDIADHLNLSVSIVKKYTCKKDKCKEKHKKTKTRWSNLEIFRKHKLIKNNEPEIKSTLYI